MKLCLDVSHAYTCSRHETRKLAQAFAGRISQIHFSGTYRRKSHRSLRKVSKAFMLSIQPIMELDVPIVIEEDMEVESMHYVHEEIAYCKSLFG